MALRTTSNSKASASILSAGTSGTQAWISGTNIGAWVGYHIFISASTGHGQVRFGQVSGGTSLLFVSEPWSVEPTTGNVYQAYNAVDLDTTWGNDWGLKLKTTYEWDGAQDEGSSVNGAGLPAIIGFVNAGVDMDAAIHVSGVNSVLTMGKRVGVIGENPTDGLYYKLNNSITTSGYVALAVVSGGYLDFSDVKCFSVYPHRWQFDEGSNITLDGVVSFSQSWGSQFNGNILGTNLLIIGRGLGSYVYMSSGFNNFEGPIKLSNTYGFYPPSGHSNPSGQTIIINQYVSIAANQDVKTGNDTIWQFRNPTWGTPIIDWTQQNDGNSTVTEFFSLNAEAYDITGGIISGVVLHTVEGSGAVSNLTLYNYNTSNSLGVVSDWVQKRQWTTSSTSSNRGPHDVKMFHYNYQTYNSPDVVFDEGKTFISTLLTDESVVASQDAASAYTIDVVFSSTSGNEVFAFSNGTEDITGLSGSSVVNNSSAASGYVIEVLGTSAEGKLVLTGVSGAWTQDDEILIQGETTAKGNVETTGFNEFYTYMINANGNAVQNIYDYCKVYVSSATSSVGSWISGARRTHGQILYRAGDNFYTQQETSAGVFVANYGAGNFDYMESDDGTQYTPPSQVTLEINGVETGSEPTNYVRCHIETLSGGPEPSGKVLLNSYANQSDGAGFYKATAAYQYGGSQPVVVRARYKGYLPFTTNATIESNGLKITAIWIQDSIFTP